MRDLIEVLSCDDKRLAAWRHHDYSFLEQSSASAYLRRLLPEKAGRRAAGTKRFFGEAVVAASTPHLQGWYGSFKWFECYPATTGKADEWFHDEFRGALCGAFPRMGELHAKFGAITKVLGVGRPVPPDLWLVVQRPDSTVEHRFIEVKLPDDTHDDRQVAGLAVIASCLPRETVPVSVSIAALRSATTPPLNLKGVREQFEEMCARLIAAGLSALPGTGQTLSV